MILHLPFNWLKGMFHLKFNECQKAKQAFTQTLLPACLAGLCPVEPHTLAMLTIDPISPRPSPHDFVLFPFLSVLQHQAPSPRQITIYSSFKILRKCHFLQEVFPSSRLFPSIVSPWHSAYAPQSTPDTELFPLHVGGSYAP